MPFQSKAQNAWAHTAAGTKALGGAAKVKEWEGATDYSHLPQHKAGGGTVNKGYQAQPAHYAKGGAVQDRTHMKDFGKTSSGRFGDTRGDWKESHQEGVGDTSRGVGEVNKRTDTESPDRLGKFLGGGDRFTSQNFAEQGEPASMQRIKPDENWSKEHVKLTSEQKKLRWGDQKSEAPRTPRGRGAAILGR